MWNLKKKKTSITKQNESRFLDTSIGLPECKVIEVGKTDEGD